MADDTSISWAGSTLNVGIGCERVSSGCDNCYADELVSRYAGQTGWPADFETGIWKPQKLGEITKWAKKGGRRIFVNSLSDVHWDRWSHAEVSDLYDAMLAEPVHDYLVLTKRPMRMASFLDGWRARHGLAAVPPWIWLGTSIEDARYNFRARILRSIPATVRFISAEPLLGPLMPALDLEGISWVIAGGESGAKHRPFDLQWAHELRDACAERGAAFFFKQIGDRRPGQSPDALGEVVAEYPLEHPAFRRGERVLGVHLDPPPETPVVVAPKGQESLL